MDDRYFLVSDDTNKIEGTVTEKLPNTKFRVQLEDGREIIAYLGGKMRLHYIKVIEGDRVVLELSPDGNNGRIVFRK